MLRKAGLSEEADPENNLGGSSKTMYYIGLDVHKKTISYCVKDAAGCVYQEGKIGSTRHELDAWIRTLPQPRTIAMEATISGTQPLCRLHLRLRHETQLSVDDSDGVIMLHRGRSKS